MAIISSRYCHRQQRQDVDEETGRRSRTSSYWNRRFIDDAPGLSHEGALGISVEGVRFESSASQWL